MKTRQDDLCVTGLGSVTRYGIDLDAIWEKLCDAPKGGSLDDYSLDSFKAAAHIADRRMLKAISKTDAIGLAAFEEAIKNSGLKKESVEHHRKGVYVGAPAASAFDNTPYLDAQKKAGGNLKHFGVTCLESRPTTLLVGLPNNVLCYGALVIDARGPNDNYNSGDLSGIIAVINAAKQINRGRLDFAVAGGFAGHTEAVNSWMFHRLGHARWPAEGREFVTAPYGEGEDGAVIADGATFITLESRANASARGAKPIATLWGAAHRSDGLGPNVVADNSDGLERAIRAALAEAKISVDDVGLIFANAYGFGKLDAIEADTISTMFSQKKPPVAFLSRHLGNSFEAAGLVEIAIAERLDGGIPESLRPAADSPLAAHRGVYDSSLPYYLSLRVSAWGEYSCLVLKRELQA